MPHEKNSSAVDTQGDDYKECGKCGGQLEPNIGYDNCPHCGHKVAGRYITPDDVPGMLPRSIRNQIFDPNTASSCPGCGTAMEDPNGTCPNCAGGGGGMGTPMPSMRPSFLAKWQVVALGEMQQPGGVGATQTTGLVDGDAPEGEDHFTDAGRNSFEQNVALETWVNFAVDMLNRGRSEEEIKAQLAHDGCPEPEQVLQRAMSQPEDNTPMEGAQDPFEVPYQGDGSTGEMQSTSQQPPVVTSKKEWSKPWEEKDEAEDEEPDDDVDDSKKSKYFVLAEDAGAGIFDVKADKTPTGDLFDFEGARATPEDLFDVEAEKTENPEELLFMVEPGGEMGDPGGLTKDQYKGSKVRIAGTTMTGYELERWEDLWGQGLVRVALDGGGTLDVAPDSVQLADEEFQHPVTEIQQFIDSIPQVEPTRPSIMARVANLELVRRAARANISKVGFSDQVRLQQLDSDAQNEILYLKDNFGIVASAADTDYLVDQPRFQIDAYDLGDRPSVVNTEFNRKARERAAVFLVDLPKEARQDEGQLVYAAAQYAVANNGDVGQFVDAVKKEAAAIKE